MALIWEDRRPYFSIKFLKLTRNDVDKIKEGKLCPRGEMRTATAF